VTKPLQRQSYNYVPDEYEGLSGIFASACCDADREYGRQQDRRQSASPAIGRLPESTKQAIDWLLSNNDADRLKKFIEDHPSPGIQKIVAYIKGQRS
jgi:hypothetical protein